MNFELIGQLVRLRYKLLWAKTRSRNGRIALFLAGYLLLVFVGALLAAGGFGAGLAAVRTGKAELVARVVLSVLYLQALLATVILGFGVNDVFVEAELRRYPLRARERRLARHFLGVLDPFWFLILALELGLAVGLYIFGAASFWLGLIAVLLLFVSNYLFARVIALLVERLMLRKGGSVVLLAVVLSLSMLPAMAGPALRKNPAVAGMLLAALHYAPPFGAAAAMTQSGMAPVYGLALLAWWLVGLTAALVALERRPPRARAAQETKIRWDSPYERVAGLFGPRHAPLVAQWLRFYIRNNRFRTIYSLTLPLLAFLTITYGRMGRHPGPNDLFVAALGAFTISGFMGIAQFSVNQFGYTAGGFRRYLLLPTEPAAALRAGSYAFLLLGSLTIPAAGVAWLLFSPLRSDARMLLMLLGSAITGMFAFHGVGVWVTLLNPRRSNYYSSFGNDLSLGGNVVVIGGVLAALFVPRLLAKAWPPAVAAENWWATIPTALVAVAFYAVSMRSGCAVFLKRRERLMAVVEGRT